MGIFSRLFKTIFLIVGVYVIAVNVIRWANLPHVADIWLNDNTFISFTQFQGQYQMQKYWGFKWFFDVISTFPGATTTVAMFNKYGNIISMFPTTFDPNNINILEGIIAILAILFTPALLGITIVIDILNNVLWFFSFLSM